MKRVCSSVCRRCGLRRSLPKVSLWGECFFNSRYQHDSINGLFQESPCASSQSFFFHMCMRAARNDDHRQGPTSGLRLSHNFQAVQFGQIEIKHNASRRWWLLIKELISRRKNTHHETFQLEVAAQCCANSAVIIDNINGRCGVRHANPFAILRKYGHQVPVRRLWYGNGRVSMGENSGE